MVASSQHSKSSFEIVDFAKSNRKAASAINYHRECVMWRNESVVGCDTPTFINNNKSLLNVNDCSINHNIWPQEKTNAIASWPRRCEATRVCVCLCVYERALVDQIVDALLRLRRCYILLRRQYVCLMCAINHSLNCHKHCRTCGSLMCAMTWCQFVVSLAFCMLAR